MKKYLLCLGLCGLLVGTNAQSDTTITINDFYVDYAVPDIGAFSLLQRSPKAVAKPGNVKELALDVLPLANDAPNIANGMALDWAPYRTFMKDSLRQNPRMYRKDAWIRNLQVSVGSVQSPTAGTDLAMGLKWTPFDESDPLLDRRYQVEILTRLQRILIKDPTNAVNRTQLQNDLIRLTFRIDSSYAQERGVTRGKLFPLFQFNLDDEGPAVEVPDPDELYATCMDAMAEAGIADFKTRKALDEALKKIIDRYILMLAEAKNFRAADRVTALAELEEFKMRYERMHWNRRALTIGLGTVWNAPDNTWNTVGSDRFSAFVNYLQPLVRNDKTGFGAQLLFLGQIVSNYSPLPGQQRSIVSLGGRILAGNNRFRVSAEGRFDEQAYEGLEPVDNMLRISLGLEVRFFDGLWLEIAAGTSGSTEEYKKAGIFSLANFKYAFQKERRFKFIQ